MLCLLKYLHFCTLLFFIMPLRAIDFEAIFGDKHCVEASLVSLSLNNEESIILDSNNPTQESVLVNSTKTSEKNSISKINELAQYNEIEFLYTLTKEDGPPHAKTYVVKLKLGDETYEGSGSSLKKAKQAAAASALLNTYYEYPPEKLQEEQVKSQTPTVMLNNVAMKLGISVQYWLLNGREEQAIDSYGSYDAAFGKSKAFNPKINSSFDSFKIPTENSQISGPFTVRVNFGEFSFKGIGHTVQGARHDAALKALQHMQDKALFKNNVCLKDESVKECREKKESLKSPISRVYETAQRHNLPVEFNVISETGKSHKKEFITECKVANFKSQGAGFSKKESKKVAAEKMMEHLSHLPAVYNEKSILNGLSNKKKKRKKKKIQRENMQGLMGSVVQVASNLWTTTDDIIRSDKNTQSENKSNRLNNSPKNKLLEIAAKLNIPIEFTDIHSNENVFLALASLGVKPPHLCLGKAAKREASHDVAALHGLKLLHKSGIFEKLDFSHFEKSVILEDLEDIEDGSYQKWDETNKDI